jgi:predicted nucleic acid-binding protein
MYGFPDIIYYMEVIIWKEFCLSFALSYCYKITIYDAVYIALAQALGCKFITADQRLFKKIKELKNVAPPKLTERLSN